MHPILHTQYYPPEIGAPQSRLHELSVHLVRKGIQVTVLTAMPSYPQGKIYDGYRGWLRTETLDGVRVVRTAVLPTQSPRMVPRLLSYFSFVLSSLVMGIWKMERADYLLTESPPLFLGLAGFIISRVKRARWIFNIADLWPESVVELGLLQRESRGYKISTALERALYKRAWLVTGQSRSILENICQRFPNIRTYHLSNGADTTFFQPNDHHAMKRDFQVVYAGLHGLAQGLHQILLAAHRISREECIAFTLVGDGPEKLKLIDTAHSLALKKIRFLPPVPKNEIPKILSEADVIVVPLKTQLTGAVPSKLYEAMSMGKPVILIAESEASQIVKDANCGIVVVPGDIDGLVMAIKQIKHNPLEGKKMGMNGRDAVVRKYDRSNIASQFAQFLMEQAA